MSKLVPYRKRSSTKVWDIAQAAYNSSVESGDLMVDKRRGKLYRAVESNGAGQRSSGDLTPKEIKPRFHAKIVWENDGLYWKPLTR